MIHDTDLPCRTEQYLRAGAAAVEVFRGYRLCTRCSRLHQQGNPLRLKACLRYRFSPPLISGLMRIDAENVRQMTGRAEKRCGVRVGAEIVRGVTCNGFSPYEVTPLPHGCIR